MQKINIDKQTIVFFILATILFSELLIAFPWEIKKISDLTKQTTEVAQRVTSIENQWPRKDKYLKDKSELLDEIKRIKEKFILKQQESKILSFISVSSKDFKVKIQSLTPGVIQEYTSTKFGEFKYLPVAIKADSGFHDLVLFLNYLKIANIFLK